MSKWFADNSHVVSHPDDPAPLQPAWAQRDPGAAPPQAGAPPPSGSEAGMYR